MASKVFLFVYPTSCLLGAVFQFTAVQQFIFNKHNRFQSAVLVLLRVKQTCLIQVATLFLYVFS